MERKKDAAADYLATVRRLGLDLGAEGPVTRESAVEAMRFIKSRRGLDPLSLCQDIVDREPDARGHGGGGSAGHPARRTGHGAGRGRAGLRSSPSTPSAPPVIPPQEVASPTVPQVAVRPYWSTTTT